MRLLLTGGAGFIGHHVVEHFLKNTDWEIIILEGFNYAGILKRIVDISIFGKEADRIRFVYHDIRAEVPLMLHRQIGHLDYVIHMAAETHVDRSLEDPITFYRTNVMGTAHILEYCRKYQPMLKKYIQVSTDEVYGAAPFGIDYKEWDRMKPSNPYSAGKAGGDMAVIGNTIAFGMPCMITRSMNNFGERQDIEKFIPKTIQAIMKGMPVVLHGNPQKGQISSRKWLHARNHADAILFLLENGKPINKNTDDGIYNIVGDEMNVLEVAEYIGKILGKTEEEYMIEWLDFHKTRIGHDLRYSLDGSKLAAMGWKAPIPLLQSLEKTIKWSLENKEWLQL